MDPKDTYPNALQRAQRKPYTPPDLVEYGSLKDLTQASTGNKDDTLSGSVQY